MVDRNKSVYLTLTNTYSNSGAAGEAQSSQDELCQLLAACRREERVAQRRLYDRFAPLIFGIIRRYCNDEQTAQDIHSETFIRIFNRLSQYRFEGAFEGWMRRIAIHAVADYFRKQPPHKNPLPEDNTENSLYTEAIGTANLDYQLLLGLVQALPDTQRAVFNLFVFEQYAHKDIAALLGISENNSRWHLNDARRRLKEKITAINR